jgi:hypothetical protein
MFQMSNVIFNLFHCKKNNIKNKKIILIKLETDTIFGRLKILEQTMYSRQPLTCQLKDGRHSTDRKKRYKYRVYKNKFEK